VPSSEESVRATYDAIAAGYDREISDELDHKPLDRALLAAVVSLAGPGPLGDVGCGPGHVSAHLAALGASVVGVDLSPAMVAAARTRAPGLTFEVGSMLALPAADAAWAGAVLLYSVIHLTPAERRVAFGELARVVQPGGPVLVSFHVSDAEQPAGSTKHLTSWFGHDVDVSVGFLDPDVVAADLVAAGLVETARLLREPGPDEYPSRRAYLLARRVQPTS
jgi:SAM-dependent methyltransferase